MSSSFPVSNVAAMPDDATTIAIIPVLITADRSRCVTNVTRSRCHQSIKHFWKN